MRKRAVKMAISPAQMKLNINSDFFSLRYTHKDAEIAYRKFLSCHLVENKNHSDGFVSVRRSPCLGKYTKRARLLFCHLCQGWAWQTNMMWQWRSSCVTVLYLYLYGVLWFWGVRCSVWGSGNLHVAETLQKWGCTWLALSANNQKKTKEMVKGQRCCQKTKRQFGTECDILKVCIWDGSPPTISV